MPSKAGLVPTRSWGSIQGLLGSHWRGRWLLHSPPNTPPHDSTAGGTCLLGLHQEDQDLGHSAQLPQPLCPVWGQDRCQVPSSPMQEVKTR